MSIKKKKFTTLWNYQKNIKGEGQTRLYEVMAVPCGLYGRETWILYARTRNRTQASEMTFLRSVIGVPRRDGLRNGNIRNALAIYTTGLSNTDRVGWTMHQDRLPKQLMFYLPMGNNNIRR